ncbi:MAG: hypothetical protein P8Y49_01405 [Sulfurovaceae bacterium]
MKWTILLISIFSIASAVETSDAIKNQTDKDMICIATYPSVYTEKIVDGKKRNVQTYPPEEVIKTIKPNQVFKKTREGFLVCYNEVTEISSSKENNIQRINAQINPEALKSHLSWHNRFNLTKYENKTRDDVEKEFGIAQRCAAYKQGQYCNYAFGLDIYFNQDKKIKSVFLYGNTVNNGKLPFEAASIYKLRNNSKPMGLWVQKSYKKLFKDKPTINTNSLIMWSNPSKYIEKVIMTAKNGHFEISRNFKNGKNLFKNGWKDSDEAIDFVNTIEVKYK